MQVKSFLKEEHPYYYSKTEKGWNRENRVINPDAEGMRMWHNGYCEGSAIYYRIEETHEPSPEELAALRAERRKKQKKYAASSKARKEAEIRENEARKWQKMMDIMERKNRNIIKNMLCVIAFSSNKTPIYIPSKAVVFDTETTGSYAGSDEILQISIIDVDENVLMNTYVKPYFTEEWPGAQAIHGISPEMVKDAPYLHEIIADIKAIFDATELIIGYNITFDVDFLKFAGIDLSNKRQDDVMVDFAPLYGDYNEYYQNFKWQKLRTCARYFDYDFKPHDSLQDVLATLHCYKKINELKKEGLYEKRLEENLKYHNIL